MVCRLLLCGLAAGYLTLAGCKPSESDTGDKNASVQQTLELGWQHYAEGAYESALQDFDRVIGMPKATTGERQTALYSKGMVWDLRRPGEDATSAGRFYGEALQIEPQGPLSPWVLLAQARQRHLAAGSGVNPGAIREAYQRIISTYPDHAVAEEAFLFLQTTYLVRRDPGDARHASDALREFVVTKPRSAQVSAAWDLIARAEDVLGHPDKRLAAGMKALETSESNPMSPRTDRASILWTLAAQAEFEVGDFATARRLLGRLIAEYPTDDRGYGVRLALARMDKVENQLRSGRTVAEVRGELDPARQ